MLSNTLFEETAEEMVNRLFKTWIDNKTFVNTLPMTDPVLKETTIASLKKFDDIYRRGKAKGVPIPKEAELRREYMVLKEVTILFSVWADEFLTTPRPKPTHRQQNRKYNHLRVVVNQ